MVLVKEKISRDVRQQESVNKIFAGNVKGILLAITGIGKTRISNLVHKKLINKNYDFTALIIVPTITLVNQWRVVLNHFNITSTTIYTINTAISKSILEYDLIIYDECHMYVNGVEFSKVFSLAKADYELLLTATLTAEEEYKLLKFGYPVLDRIPLQDAQYNGWVSKSIEYNLYLDFPADLRKRYNAMHEMIDKYYAHFNFDYETLQSCTRYNSFIVKGKSFIGAYQYVIENNIEENDIDGNRLTDEECAKKLVMRANQYNILVQRRKELLYGADVKVEMAAKLIKAFNMKTVTFGEVTEAADKLTQLCIGSGIKAVAYHSNIKTQLVEKGELSRYGITAPIKNIKDYTKSIKVSAKRLMELYIKQLEQNDITCINSAKALDLGLDVKGMQLAIILAGNTNAGKQKQRKGRVIRDELINGEEKIAIIVNLIIKDSKDSSWARTRQKGSRGIIEVNSFNELMQNYWLRIR